MMAQKKFIYTDSEESAKQLKDMGLQLIYRGENQWFFLNSGKLNFSSVKQTVYTDVMFT